MRKRAVSLILCLCMVILLLPVPISASGTHPFADVSATDWFNNSVQYVYDHNLMNGTTERTFSPNDMISRGMITAILYRMEQSPLVTRLCPFRDVESGKYYEAAIVWSLSHGIITGYDALTFKPDEPIKRQQLIAILRRYAVYKGYDVAVGENLTQYEDNHSIDVYARIAMSWAVKKGLLSDAMDGKHLHPQEFLSRAYASAILTRFCQNVIPAGKRETLSRTESASYTVTFDLNYDGGGVYQATTVQNGGKVTQPRNPSRDKYTFVGWSTSPDKFTKFNFKSAISENVTLYARWVRKSSSGSSSSSSSSGSDAIQTIVTTCVVTFNSNGGSAVPSQTVTAGNTVARPTNPTRDDYSFGGWYSDSQLTAAYDFTRPVTQNLTLYAKWSEGFFRVTFETDGGSDVTTQSINAGNEAIRPVNPTKTGFVFDDWYSDSTRTTVYDFSRPLTSDITLYAKWNAIQVNIVINPDKYDNNIVNRTVTGSVTSNIAIDNVAFALAATHHTTADTLELDGNGAFSADVLLEDGSNEFTVTVLTADGTESTKSATLMYDSGYVYFSQPDYPYDDYFDDERLTIVPVYFDETAEEPSEYLVANLINLYFDDATTVAERREFITGTLGGSVAGYLSVFSMMQALLPQPLTNAERLTLGEANSLYDDLIASYDSYGIIRNAEFESIYTGIMQATASPDPWSDNPQNPSSSNDTNRWWIERIQAEDAWQYDNFHGLDYLTDIQIGVADGGFDVEHEDLQGRIRVISKEKSPTNHGTQVAGIINATADNGLGLAGVLHNNGTISAYDLFKKNQKKTSVGDVSSALAKLVESGAKVINFSVGGNDQELHANPTQSDIEDLLKKIEENGKTFSFKVAELLSVGFDFVVVQTAGNGNELHRGVGYWNNLRFAAINRTNCSTIEGKRNRKAVTVDDIIDRILIVSNVQQSRGENGEILHDLDNHLYFQSNGFEEGNHGDLHVVAAPGTDIFSTINDNLYTSALQEMSDKIGTSFSAPIVTGICGLVWSINQELSGAQVVSIVTNNCVGKAQTADAIYPISATGGMGIVNAYTAVTAAVETLPTYVGKVVDATNGAALSGVSVQIHKNFRSGPVVWEDEPIFTDSSGVFRLPKLPEGNYVLEFTKDGYVTYYQKLNAEALTPVWKEEKWTGQTVGLNDVMMSSTLHQDDYRLILRWGKTPADLDAHLVATTLDGSSYHVYYGNRHPLPAYANLDVDDRSSYGPETITITNIHALKNIRYAVHDYTNRSSRTSKALSYSGAHVDVYKGSDFLGSAVVTENWPGTEWDICAFDAEGLPVFTSRMKFCENPKLVFSQNDILASLQSADEEDEK